MKRFFSILILTLAVIAGGADFVSAQNNNDLGKYYVMVKPDSYYKFRGDQVTFTGSHFYPGETVIVMKGATRLGTVKASANGTIVAGPYQSSSVDAKEMYTFFGTTSNLFQNVTVTVSGGGSWITLSNYYAPAGSLVTIQGHNFSKNEKVNVWYDGAFLASTPANSRGDFSLTIRIPSGGEGKRIIQAVGSKSGMKAVQTFSQAR